jgi:hypothetical protein
MHILTVTITLLVICVGLIENPGVYSGQAQAKSPGTNNGIKTPPSKSYKAVSVQDLLKAPGNFVKQSVSFQGVFSSFSDLGLDYPRVMRSSRDYLSLIIFRPDVTHHQIPLSELKLIAPRKISTSLEKLSLGDQVRVQGKVVSDALGEPWVDVDQVIILKKAPAKVDKQQ